METHDRRYASLKDVLEREIALLATLYACQKRMYEAVLVRDWVMLQKEIALGEGISGEFSTMEDERQAIMTSIVPDADLATGFYRVSSKCGDSDRVRLNTLYREMKRLLLLSKTESDVFTTYVSNARTLLGGLLETVIAGGKGRIYTRRGCVANRGLESVVLNRSF